MTDAKVLDASIGPPVGPQPSGQMAPPSVVCSSLISLHLGPSYGNLNGVIHGGAFGVIFDMLTTVALGAISRPGFWEYDPFYPFLNQHFQQIDGNSGALTCSNSLMGGVTRVLNISYLTAVPIGTTVYVHAYVYQVGKTMAYIKGWMTSEDSKTIYAVCEHQKVHVPSLKEHLAYKLPSLQKSEAKDSKL